MNLKRIRMQAGKTQKEVTTDLCIPQSSYSQYESGVRRPNYETLQKLAEYYGVTVDYLLGHDVEHTPALQKEDEISYRKIAEMMLEFATRTSPYGTEKPTTNSRELSEDEEALLKIFNLVPAEKRKAVVELFEISLRLQGLIE